MFRTFSLGFAAALALLLAASCSDDGTVTDVTPNPSYKTLDGERDAVLFNLQQCHDDRNIMRYDELLDRDFVFFFSETDYNSGSVPYEQWGRAAELGAVRNLFDPHLVKPVVEPASAIGLKMIYASGDDAWVEVAPTDTVRYPGETWHKKTVTYSLSVKSGDRELIGNNIHATFTVRRATDAQNNKWWRIVLWQDDTGSGLRTDADRKARTALSEDRTWGVVKALYSN